MPNSGGPHIVATSAPRGDHDRQLPVGVAALVIAAGSAIGWATIIGITAALLRI